MARDLLTERGPALSRLPAEIAGVTMVSTTIYVQPDGPYVVTGSFSLAARGAPRDEASVVLCRCGHSSNKPYCDGTHTRIGFVDPGLVQATSDPASEAAAERLAITPEPNGPLQCFGSLALAGADGRTCERRSAELCRCGGSATKPFCDRSHARIGFVG
jgi:CDGSH-type Zn-finger protein